jgi:hypothetical protein
MVAFPEATAVTTPDADTLLMAVLFELHAIERPVSTLLLASRVTAESCTVLPTCSVEVAGDTVTDATGAGGGALTVIAADEICPSLEAVTDTLPATTAVTSPEVETVAIPAFPEFQLMTRPVSTLLFASRVTADSCTVPPTWRLADAGETETVATGTGAGALTVREADAVFPSLAAVIAAVPAATAEISPLPDTVATLVLPLCQVTARPVRVVPLES